MSLETMIEFLGWCTLLNIAVLALSAMVLAIANTTITSIQAKSFGIPPDQAALVAYRYLANYKVLILIFNIVPYLSLRFVTGYSRDYAF